MNKADERKGVTIVTKLVSHLGILSFSILCIALVVSASALAHRDGCHRWHSCPSDSGSYVCGDLGNSSECGSTAPTPAPTVVTPRTPVKSTKNISRTESVAYKTTVKYDYREYKGYKKLGKSGTEGVRTITTTISLTDGAETGRKDVSNTVTTAPINEIIIKGGRNKPSCKFYGVADSKPGFLDMNKGKVNLWGKCTPDTELILSVNGNKDNTTKSNSKGWFVFENIDLGKNKIWVKLYAQIDDKEKAVSEKTRIYVKTKKMLTEYKILHTKSN